MILTPFSFLTGYSLTTLLFVKYTVFTIPIDTFGNLELGQLISKLKHHRQIQTLPFLLRR